MRDNRDDWSEHQPSAAEENEFIEQHGWTEYGRWHLGVDDDADEQTKSRYKFPYGDFKKVHRCAILAAESRAGQTTTTTSSSPPRKCTACSTPSGRS